MKNEMKLNNKGFSLVELIVVIAIMAILVGVLAPSVLGQINKAKLSKDKQAVDAVATAVAIAWADPDATSKPAVSTGTVTNISTDVGIGITYSGSAVPYTATGSTFQDLCKATVGFDTIKVESNEFSGVSGLTIEMNGSTGKVTVTATGSAVPAASGSGTEEYSITK